MSTRRRRHRLDDPGHLLLLADRTLALRRLLRKVGVHPLGDRTVLDLGCGAGDSLATLLAAGGPARVTGIDPDESRIARARDRIRPGRFEVGDARALPFDDSAFDIALLFTVLSSVPDDADRRAIAAEARRVVRPGGGVLVYDFALNPGNRETRGLSERDARILFGGCTYESLRVTPLPALARRLARSGRPRTWLSRLPVPRTHHLLWITLP
jgi:ubiquinone/menaquinone biosynthesis C-methylase UbiE